MVIQTILGAWDRSSAFGRHSGSKLSMDITDREAAYSYTTFNTCYKDTGLFGIYLVAPEDKLQDAMGLTIDHIARLGQSVTDDEVERAKTQLKANMLIQLDSFSNVAEDIGRQILTYGRRMPPAEMFARINALTTQDIRNTANKLLIDEDHALAAIGPINSLPDYNWIRKKSILQ